MTSPHCYNHSLFKSSTCLAICPWGTDVDNKGMPFFILWMFAWVEIIYLFFLPYSSLRRSLKDLHPHVRDCVKSYIQPWLVVSRRLMTIYRNIHSFISFILSPLNLFSGLWACWSLSQFKVKVWYTLDKLPVDLWAIDRNMITKLISFGVLESATYRIRKQYYNCSSPKSHKKCHHCVLSVTHLCF